MRITSTMRAFIALSYALACSACSADVSAPFTFEVIDAYCASSDIDSQSVCQTKIIQHYVDEAALRELSDKELVLWGHSCRQLIDWLLEGSNEIHRLQNMEKSSYRLRLERNPTDSDARFFLALAQDQYEVKIDMLESLVSRDPAFLAAHMILSTEYENQEDADLEKAHQHYLKAFEHATGSWKAKSATSAIGSARKLKKSKEVAQVLRELRDYYGTDNYLNELKTLTHGAPLDPDVFDAAISVYCSMPYYGADKMPCLETQRILATQAAIRHDDPALQELRDNIDQAIEQLGH